MSLAARVAQARPLGGPRFLDRRFDSAGAPVPCPGNTVIRHISDPSELDRLCAAQDQLKNGPAGACFAWLPRASLHCTLFNGLIYGERAQAAWPTTLPNDATRAQADAHMQSAFARTPPPDGPVDMEVRGFSGTGSDALGLSLIPSTKDDATLRAYRDALAQASGLSHRPGHANYAFHITLGYLVAWPDQVTAQAFDAATTLVAAELASKPITLCVDDPEFCHFETLDHFEVTGRHSEIL